MHSTAAGIIAMSSCKVIQNEMNAIKSSFLHRFIKIWSHVDGLGVGFSHEIFLKLFFNYLNLNNKII